MDLKDIQKRLQELRNRIKSEGCISPGAEEDLKQILNETLTSASDELTALQDKLSATLAIRTANPTLGLTEEQIKRLRILEKTGTGSHETH